MSIDDRINMLVLQEFRLQKVDTDGAVANIVASSAGGIEPTLPLLTSIDDRRHVATLRALHADESREPDAAQRAALDPFVSNWNPPKQYTPRITERSLSPSTYFRLAVTESGINDSASNDSESNPVAGFARSAAPEGTPTSVGLLWVGRPLGTYAGLLVLMGGHDDPDAADSGTRDWAVPLSRDLGVRIYDTRPG